MKLSWFSHVFPRFPTFFLWFYPRNHPKIPPAVQDERPHSPRLQPRRRPRSRAVGFAGRGRAAALGGLGGGGGDDDHVAGVSLGSMDPVGDGVVK